MRKRGLKDVKRRNRQVIIETVMEKNAVSRVEIAQATELAGSTVSALVGELLEEGILAEAGTVTTAGRSRTALMINPGFGSVVVFEIGRRESCVTCFDMALQPIRSRKLARRYVTGNELLGLISKCIDSWQTELPPIVGIGLLFQEDMRESDFRVIYSTGLSSATITLREALMTQYRIPIEEEYSVAYTVTDAMTQELDPEARNSACISVGSRILASVRLDGREIPLRKNFCEELAGAMDWEVPGASAASCEEVFPFLENLIVMLFALFPLDTVFLSGTLSMSEETMHLLHQLCSRKLSADRILRLKLIPTETTGDGKRVIARQVQRKALIAR